MPDTTHTIGRRKEAVCRLYIKAGSGKWSVNGRTLGDYFPRPAHVSAIQQPFTITDTLGRYDVKAKVEGGGLTGQAGALRLAVARALVKLDESHRRKLRQLELAQKLARDVILRGDNVLFVCTKRQLVNIVKSEAERCGAMYVTERWLGGLLTNFQTVKKQVRRLKELEAGSEAGGDFENYTKKEQLMMGRQRDKLSKNLSGIKNLTRLPGLMFVIDSKKERIAVSEGNKLGIPIIALVDTNADPDLITVPIAGNDDAIKSVELVTHAISDAIVEARREAPIREEVEEAESYTYSSDRGAEPEGEGDKKRKRRPRRRRAKPEAIAAGLKTGGDEGGGAGEGTETEQEG